MLLSGLSVQFVVHYYDASAKRKHDDVSCCFHNSFNSFNSCSFNSSLFTLNSTLAPMGAPVPIPQTSRSRRWCGCRALPVPRCPDTGCRCLSASSVATRQCSNEIRHCSRCSRPSRFHLRWNTMRLLDDPCGCSPSSTFRVLRQSGDGYNAGGYSHINDGCFTVICVRGVAGSTFIISSSCSTPSQSTNGRLLLFSSKIVGMPRQ